jgi:hypothetical protein
MKKGLRCKKTLDDKDTKIEDQRRRLKEAILELDRSNCEHDEQTATNEQEIGGLEERNWRLEEELDATKMAHQDEMKDA